MEQVISGMARLVRELVAARNEEAIARGKRVMLEEDIAALVETPMNSSRTVEAGEGLKVTVKRALSYKADVDAIRSGNVVPEELMPLTLVPAKPAEYVFDEKKYEQIIEDNPDAAARLAEHVIAKPRKVTVTPKIS